MLDRGDKLRELQERSGELRPRSFLFRSHTKAIQRKMCCQKVRCILIIVISLIITVVILVILFLLKPWDKDSGGGHPGNSTYIKS